MTYIDKRVIYERVTYMSHVSAIYDSYMGSIYDMLYVTYKSHMSCMHDIYVTNDKATYTTLYGIHICDIYVSHM